jgi:hypothetical protein
LAFSKKSAMQRATTKQARNVINSNNWKDGTILLVPGQDPEETARMMVNVIRAVKNQVAVGDCLQIANFMQQNGNVSLPLAIGMAAYKMAFFDPDITHQTIRTPNAIAREKKANCVAYTVLICAAALNCVDDVRFCLVDVGNGVFDHVYPIICGVAVDVVPCQDQNGLEKIFRKPLNLPKFSTFGVARAQIFNV